MKTVIDHDAGETPIFLDGVSPALRAKQEGKYPGLTEREIKTLEQLECVSNHRLLGIRFDQKCERCGMKTKWMTDDMNKYEIQLLEKVVSSLEQKIAEKPKFNKHGAHELGPREFTLTYSPEWGMSDAKAQDDMRIAVNKLLKWYKDEIIEFHAVGEFTKSGQAHIHGIYHLVGGLKITNKNFERAWPYWNPKKKLGRGFVGGHHEVVRSVSDFKGYIEKSENQWFSVNVSPAKTAADPPSLS